MFTKATAPFSIRRGLCCFGFWILFFRQGLFLIGAIAFLAALVKGRVECVKVFAVELIRGNTQPFTETGRMK